MLGAWLDRTRRQRLALASNQVLLAASLLAILAAAGRVPAGLLPLAALAGLTGPLATGGYTSMIPLLVLEWLLARANALEATSFNTAAIAGPAVAGVVAGTAGLAGAVLAEAVLAALALPAIARLPRVPSLAGDQPAPLGTAIRHGLGHLARTPGAARGHGRHRRRPGRRRPAHPGPAVLGRGAGRRPGRRRLPVGGSWRRGRSPAPWPPPARPPAGRPTGSC